VLEEANVKEFAAREPQIETLDEHVGHLLRKAHQRASGILLATLGEQNLTPTQYFAMARLRDRSQLSQNLLGRLSAMDPATIQGVIHRLMDRGFVRRSPDPKDRRRMVLQLTGRGEMVVDNLNTALARVNDTILDPLSPAERGQFVDMLQRLA
jgi:DNA-binding MarR family transcriptional regulator